MRNNHSRKWSRRTPFGSVSPRTRGTLLAIAFAAFVAGVSLAFGINDSGEIVGTTTIANGNYVPFLYRNGIMTRLGMTSGGLAEALAINNLGQIVGIGITASGAFLYQNGSFIDLGTLGPTGNLVDTPRLVFAGTLVPSVHKRCTFPELLYPLPSVKSPTI